MPSRTRVLIGFISALFFYSQALTIPKIVGLVRARNNATTIEQCLRALACYTDALVVLDNASEDETVQIIKSLQTECAIERIVRKSFWYEDDTTDYNRMLIAGREIGGTHFIVINPDELFTANCQDNNLLKEKILSLQPGESLTANVICLWETTELYRIDDGYAPERIAFCDDTARYPSTSLDKLSTRIPESLDHNKTVRLLPFHKYGLLSFAKVSWDNLVLKTIWKKCFDRVCDPTEPASQINKKYKQLNDNSDVRLIKTPSYWFDNYSFFDNTLYTKRDTWHEDQIKQWVHLYGQDYFDGLGFVLVHE